MNETLLVMTTVVSISISESGIKEIRSHLNSMGVDLCDRFHKRRASSNRNGQKKWITGIHDAKK